MARANATTPTGRDPLFVDEGVAGFHLSEGGSLTLLHFDDGEHRLMFERRGESFGLRLSMEDVRNLRSITGLTVHAGAS